MKRISLKLGKTAIGGIGLLITIQMFVQWQLDLDVSMTPYEIGLVAALFGIALFWAWVGLNRPVRTSLPIAQDTARWHFGRNAPIFAAAVVVLLAVVAFLSIVLPTLDPVIDTTVSRFITVPLTLIGLASITVDWFRDRSVSALNDDSRTL